MQNGQTYVVVGIWMAMAVAETRGDVPIEGDRELIDVVLAAQQTNSKQYEKGRLKADVALIENDVKTTAQVVTIWNGASAYWTYHAETVGRNRKETNGGEWIVNQGSEIVYSPRSRLLQIWRGNTHKLREALKIRPADLWFHIDRRRTGSEMLDPDFKAELLTKYVIFEKGSDQIVVQRHYKVGGYYEFRIDLSRNGNIVSYDTIPMPAEGVWIRGQFDWQQTDDGDWYVQSLKQERIISARGMKVPHSIEVTVSEYDAYPEIPTDRFTVESLNVTPETTIEEFGPAGKLKWSRKGQTSARLKTKDLDPLVETLKAGRLVKSSK